MKRAQPDNQHPACDEQHRADAFDALLRRFETPPAPERAAFERWEQLSRRINAYQRLQALIAHMTVHGSELRRATLLLRPWQPIMVPFS